jgi:hypothetical protein
LVPFRASLGKEDKPILLLLDGHVSHSVAGTVDICAENNIRTVLLPPHTSHVLQPLDVGLFPSLKAAWRRSVADPSLRDLHVPEISLTTNNRIRMLARSLIAHSNSITECHIKRAFKHTGIYPPSISHFIHYCYGVREIPDQVRNQAKEVIEKELEARTTRILGKRKRSIVSESIIV